MIASKVTRETLERAAESVGLTLNIRTLNKNGTRHQVKVNPGPVPDSCWQVDRSRLRLCPVCGVKVKITGDTADGRIILSCGDAERIARVAGHRRWKDERGDQQYQRISAGTDAERRVFAVCWHGFRDFFRAVYRLNSEATFRTAMDTWHGAEDFESRFRASGHRNVGSQMYPRLAAEVCRCPQSGLAV